MVRGEIPIELGHSWYTAKTMVVEKRSRTQSKYRTHENIELGNQIEKDFIQIIGDKIYNQKRNNSIYI